MGTDERDIERSLGKAEKACKGIRIVFALCFALCIVVWVLMLGVLVYGCITSPSNVNGATVAYCAVYGALVVVMLGTLFRIFNEVVKGNPPFSEIQARRLRIVSLAALALVVLELIFTAGVSYAVAPSAGYGIVVNDGASEPTVNLNVGMLVFSGIMYSLSAIFRYAALLQQLSDDTV